MPSPHQILGDSVLVKNVTEEELGRYLEWLDTKNYGQNMGYACFPSKHPNAVTLYITSGFSSTWRGTIVPDLEEYWGESRIIHEVSFEEE